jgi:ribosomal protein S27E
MKMAKEADKFYKSHCEECDQTVTVVDEPSAHRGDDPHWAEAYTKADANYLLCWKCGRVLWSPL